MPTNPPGQGTKTFGINVRADLLDELNQAAKLLGKSRNKLITEILEEALKTGVLHDALIEQSERLAEALGRFGASQAPTLYTLRMAGGVAAGQPISAPVEDELRVAREYPADHAAYRVCGDSMTKPDGSGILDGDTIVVRHFENDKPLSPGNNRIYIFTIGGELTLKRFKRGRSGAAHSLVSDNPEYPPVEPDEETHPIGELVEVLT